MLSDSRHMGPLPHWRNVLAPFTGNKEKSKGIVVLLVRPTLTRFPANILHTPMDKTLSFDAKCDASGASAVVVVVV